MKKLFALVLALVLCMSAAALAESIPSKTTSDLLNVEIDDLLYSKEELAKMDR